MIVVKVELWPLGDESSAREIGRMTLSNDLATSFKNPSRGSYRVRLMRRGTTDTVQREGRVENHARKSSSIWKLVKKALDAVDM